MGCFPTNKQISNVTNNNMKQVDQKQKHMNNTTEMGNSDRLNNAKQDFMSYKTILSRRLTKVETRFTIVKKLGLRFNNAFRVTDNQTYKIYVLRLIVKKQLINDHLFLPFVNKLLQTKIDNILNINEIFCDNVNYYILNDFAEGKRLFNYMFTQITYDELFLANVLYSLLDSINSLNLSSINIGYITPKDIYYHSTAKNRELKVKLNILHDDFYTIEEDLHQFLFLAPELLKLSPPYYVNDEKSSIWSLGVIFYCLFLGEFPFIKQTKEELYKEIQTKNHLKNIENSLISKSGKQLLREFLVVDRKQRINIRAALYLPFFEILLQQHIKPNLISDKSIKSFKTINSKINFLLITIRLLFNLIEVNKFLKEAEPIMNALKDNQGLFFESNQSEQLKNLLGSSLLSMQHLKLKEETNDSNAYFKIFFISIIVHWNKNNHKYLKRAFQLLDTVGSEKVSKNELITILSFSNQKEIKCILNAIDNNIKTVFSYEEYEAILFDQFALIVEKEGNYFSQYISDKQNDNLYGNKWFFPDDSFDMENVFEKNLSSSNISSASDEEKEKDKNKENEKNNNKDNI